MNKKISLSQKIKEFVEPISYSKWWRRVFFGTAIFEGFQTIFSIQAGVYIISAIEKKDIANIKFWVFVLVIIFIISYIMRRIGEMTSEIADGSAEIWLRKKYFNKYIHLDNTKTEAIGTGKMQNILFDWIHNWSGILTTTLPATIVEIWAIIYAFVLIANKAPNWKYFVWFICLFILSSALIWTWLGVLKWTRKKSKEIYLDLVRRDVKIIMSKFEILQNNKLWEEMEKQSVLTKKQIHLRQKGNTIKLLRQTGSNIIIDGMQVWIYIVVGIGIITGNFTFAYMMLVLKLLGVVSKYIWNTRQHLNEYYKGIVHIEKLWDIFASIPPMKIGKDEKDFIYKSWDIEVKDINFSYDKNPIFKDFNLTLQWWTKTAFVGQSGGWKTTLIKLLAWYITPDKGEISIDEQKLSKVKLTDYYKHIWYLTQDPSVFDGTIIENLLYALDDTKLIQKWFQQQLEKVINDAKCEFIREFEKWWETEIGERGIRLSGWQKQRLAIAKIMLKNPNIIFLDEPTSALDSFNEELINIALHNLFRWKTVIVVAHRLQTVKTADRILFLENWEITEDGTHEQLVKAKGKYKKMLDLQSGF